MSNPVGNPKDWFSHNKAHLFSELDEVTIQLFKQSNNRTFGDLTKVRALCFHTCAVHYFNGSKIDIF